MSTSNPMPIRPVMGFVKMSDADILARAIAVIQGMPGNLAFLTPPVDLAVFDKKVNAFSDAIAEALDGGKTAKAARDNRRKDVIRDLRLLAIYVENNCKDDMETFSSSGFVARTNAKASPQPTAIPVIRKLVHGAGSGQLLAYIKSVPGAYSYNLRYAALAGTTPGPWTKIVVPNIKKAVIIGNLSPATTYAFEAQALGSQGYSDWSDSSTCMCT